MKNESSDKIVGILYSAWEKQKGSKTNTQVFSFIFYMSLWTLTLIHGRQREAILGFKDLSANA